MAEPARKLDAFVDKEKDLGPNLRAISGGSESSSDRASLRAVEANPIGPAKNESIEKQESKGNVIQGPWANKVTGAGQAGKPKGGFWAGAKKKSPIAAIILTLVGGGMGIVGVLSPSMLLVHFKEALTDKFNSQLTSMDSRRTRILHKKLVGGITKGCTGAKFFCRFETMSNKQVEKLKKTGITPQGKTTAFGRFKPTSFDFKGESIDAKNLAKMKTSPEFRAALNKAYNPKWAGFADTVWRKAATRLGINEAKTKITGETDAEKLKSIQEVANKPADTATATAKTVEAGQEKPGGGTYTDAEAKALNKSAAEAADAANEIADAAKKSAAKVSKAAPSALRGAASSVGNFFKLTGAVDSVCTVYKTIRAVGYAAKTVRAAQLARFAMIFLKIADQIKAGTAKAKDVAYLGKILTREFITRAKDNSILSKKTATESFGYKYTAYGTRGKMSGTASQYLAGGGLTGELIGVTGYIDSILGGNAKKTCNTISNPFVQAGSLIGGVALMLVPGGAGVMTAKNIMQGVAGVALNVAASFAPALLQDIVAGVLIDDNTVGEAAGDAITSGASGIMSTAAQHGGNAPLTPQQAVAYTNLSNKIAEEYAEEDRLAYSPFDISNQNTFLGKFVRTIIPYASNMSSLSTAFSSVASLVIGSFASLTTSTARAADIEDFTMCQDYDYRDDMFGADGLATDPYCNVLYGIPTDALDMDPMAAEPYVAKQIDDKGNPIPETDYAKFIEKCIDRVSPLGDDESAKSDGSDCLFDVGTNKYYYIFYIDKRVQDGMDDENIGSGTMVSSAAPATIAPADVLEYCTANYGKYTSQAEKMIVFGSSEAEVASQLVAVKVPFASGMKTLYVHRKAEPCFKAAAADMQNITYRPVRSGGTFNWREIRGYEGTGKMSNHSWAVATDFDPAQNPMGGGKYPNCTTNMPPEFVEIWKRFGFRWGGDYKGRCDAMHFEWMGGAP